MMMARVPPSALSHLHPGLRLRGPVPLEYSIEWLTCAIAGRLDVVMVGLPGAAKDRLSADVPGTRPGRRGVPRGPGEGCRAAGAPARERGAAPARRPGAVRAGRPGVVRRAGTAPPPQALDRRLPRDASDAAGLAPQTGGEEVRHEQAAQAWPPRRSPVSPALSFAWRGRIRCGDTAGSTAS